MENQGWIKLHRKIQDSDMWLCEPFTKAQAWVDLILLANHKPNSFFIRGNQVKVNRGQIGYSKDSLAKRWKWSKNKVLRYLKWLETEQMLELQKSNILGLISVKNYDKYQTNGTTDETADETTERPQKDRRRVTNKNVKNDKNDKNVSLAPDGASRIDPIREIIGIFHQLNPLIEFGNTTYRKCLNDLIGQYGIEKVVGATNYALSIQSDKYAPVISNPYQLKKKFPELILYKQKNSNKTLNLDI